MSELTVYGNEELRFYKSYKKFCFFLTSVSRNVNARIGFVYDVCARTVKFVDDSVYELPGMAEEDRTTRSCGPISTFLWSEYAIL